MASEHCNWIYQPHGPHVQSLALCTAWSSSCHPGPPITFDIPLVSAASRVRTAVDTTIIRQQQTLIGETQIIMIYTLCYNLLHSSSKVEG